MVTLNIAVADKTHKAQKVKCMVADLCHVVLSCFRGEKAKGRHAKTRQMVTFSCFRVATFRLFASKTR